MDLLILSLKSKGGSKYIQHFLNLVMGPPWMVWKTGSTLILKEYQRRKVKKNGQLCVKKSQRPPSNTHRSACPLGNFAITSEKLSIPLTSHSIQCRVLHEGTFGKVWKPCWLSKLGRCYWHLVSRNQDAAKYSTRQRPTSKNYPALNASVGEVGKLLFVWLNQLSTRMDREYDCRF